MIDHALQLLWTSLEDFDGSYDHLLAELPAEEQQRATRFRIDAARHRFVLGRTVLRRHLSTSLGMDPKALAFSTSDRGKPHLASSDIDDPPYFNLSHSGNVVVLVVASVDVGVDVESLREIPNAERMAGRVFSRGEQTLINDLDEATRNRSFLRIWTQKEAYLKATGLGVGMPLREVETEPDPEAPPRLLAVAGDREEATRWTLLEAEVPGAVCIVAARGQMPTLEVRRFTQADLDAR